MAQPTPYARQYAFRAFQTANPDDPLPGQKVDIELNAVKATLDEILTNLALIQRDDGRVANNSVGTSQLDGALISLGFERPAAWATATAYAVDDAVFQNSKLYLCLVAHTSGTFNTDLSAAKWEEVIDFTTLVTDAETARDAAEAFAADAQAAQAAAEAAAGAVTGGATTWLGDSSGTNNYTVAPNAYTPVVRADGFKARFRVKAANSGAVNLTVTGYADADVRNIDESELVSGDWILNSVQEVTWNATKNWYTWDTGALVARLKANNTLTGANLFTGAVEFDAGVQMDAAVVANSTMALNGAVTVGGAAEFNADVKVDSTFSVTGSAFAEPGGRLTLTTDTPVLTSGVTGQTTVYYTPYRHASASLYDGTRWVRQTFTELSQTLADSTKSPAAAAVSSVYDVFLWDDAGTLRISRGPAWTSSTVRGTGAGTTELERLDGALVNKIAITNGPAARRGLYLGTIATNATGANGEMAMMFAPAAAAGGSNNRLDVWNNYNRVSVGSLCRDSTNTWTYSTATIRSANNSASNRVTVVIGQAEDRFSAEYCAVATCSAGDSMVRVGVGRDSTTAFDGLPGQIATGGGSSGASVRGKDSAQAVAVGSHYFQALELPEFSTTTWYGDGGAPTSTQAGLVVEGWM